MEEFKDLKEIKRECKRVTSCASGSDSFMYRCFPFFIEQLIELNEKIKSLKKIKHTKRRLSKWQLFAGKGLKEGKTIKQISKEYQKKEKNE